MRNFTSIENANEYATDLIERYKKKGITIIPMLENSNIITNIKFITFDDIGEKCIKDKVFIYGSLLPVNIWNVSKIG